MGLCLSALSECLERIWSDFGEKMSEIREFIGRIFRFPRYWSRSTGNLITISLSSWRRWRIFRVWSRAISDPARDPLKKFSPLTSCWSRAKIVKARDPLKISSSLTWFWSRAILMKDRDPLKNSNSLTWCWSRATIGLIAIRLRQNLQNFSFSALELPASSRMTCLYFLRLVFTISTVYTSSPRLN